MERIWFKNYPDGVRHEVDTDELGTIVNMFNRSVEDYKDFNAYTSVKTTLTFGQTKKLVDEFSAFLQGILKVRKGERIALMMPNVLQYPVAVFGALQAGMIVVNLNPLYTAPELKQQLLDCQATTVLVLENFAATLAEVVKEVPVKHVIIAKFGDLLHSLWGPLMNFYLKYINKAIPPYNLPHAISFKKALKLGAQTTFRPVDISSTDIAFLQYTGGTTGMPKGAMLSHKNVCSNILQAREWVSPRLEKEVCMVTPLPLYHIFSLTVNLLIIGNLGGHNILIANPRDTKTFVRQMKNKKFKITAISCVNTLFNSLLHSPEFAKLDFSTWKLALGGGAAVQQDVARKWQEVTGMPIVEAYGLTEASPGVCVNPVTIKEYTGFIGLPLPNTDVQIRNEENQVLKIGEIGLLWVKGPQVMEGYWNQPEETEKVLRDGWLDTGDMAFINEGGYVKLVDRKKEMIIVSGFNVYPNEIEDVLMQHPGILECSVIGVPNERTGEAPKAFVVRKDPNLTEKEIIEFARKSLTGYKLPKSVEFRDELPKSNVGKILRRVLQDEERQKNS
ncbi:MAG: AMP-binding protein [Neisseriaceae bacterium]